MNLHAKLGGADLISTGRANEVARQIGNDQYLFDGVLQGIFENDPAIRMRSADVAKKVSK